MVGGKTGHQHPPKNQLLKGERGEKSAPKNCACVTRRQEREGVEVKGPKGEKVEGKHQLRGGGCIKDTEKNSTTERGDENEKKKERKDKKKRPRWLVPSQSSWGQTGQVQKDSTKTGKSWKGKKVSKKSI